MNDNLKKALNNIGFAASAATATTVSDTINIIVNDMFRKK